MARYVGAAEAARQLGVQRATLYAYVSRGLIGRRVAVDGRTSLYSVDDLEHLARRVRRREAELVPRPSLDVQIVTTVTTLDEDGVRYRGHDVAELARTSSFEQVAELLWTGNLPEKVVWPATGSRRPSAGRRRRPRHWRAGAAGDGGRRQRTRHAPRGRRPAHRGKAAARCRPDSPRRAGRHRAWHPCRAPCRVLEAGAPPALASVIDRALVLLADHELATGTLAVRIAGSTWTPAYQAFAAGLAVIQGPLHGTAGHLAYQLLAECEERGAAPVVAERFGHASGSGLGHKIYKGDDPRLAPLREASPSCRTLVGGSASSPT